MIFLLISVTAEWIWMKLEIYIICDTQIMYIAPTYLCSTYLASFIYYGFCTDNL